MASVYAGDAAWALLAGVSYVLAPKMMTAVLKVLYPLLYHNGFPPEAIGDRMLFLLICALSGALFYIVARGLWRLKNWARLIAIVFFVGDAFGPRWSTDFSPAAGLLPVGPLSTILKGLLCLSVILYLVSPHVRQAFGMDHSGRTSQIVVSVVAVVILAFVIRKSGPELDAIRWHREHGNQVSINGVVFPIYRWNAARVSENGSSLEISDEPGPLRRADGNGFIEVFGKKTEAENGSTVAQLVDEKVREHETVGYKKHTQFLLPVGKQMMSCVETPELGDSIYCYGDGPIYFSFYTGEGKARGRFENMMTEAR